MRLPDERLARLLTRGLLTISIAAGLGGCTGLGGSAPDDRLPLAAAPFPVNGPQADYPVLVGEPYQIAGVTYTPEDTLNYDVVGYVALDDGAAGVTGAHHTLPVPSYAEVTSLETGRTILVRLERRGPMGGHHLLALSPAALAQLGAAPETPVRVRRVNPPEDQRAMLRAGQGAPQRMDTPLALVNVLRRRLPEGGGAPLAVTAAAEFPLQPSADAQAPIEQVDVAASSAAVPEMAPREPTALPPLGGDEAGSAQAFAVEPVEESSAAPPEQASPVPASEAMGTFLVQAATFSTDERARNAAAALSGQVFPAGRYFRVRTGPFATREEAEASLAKVRQAGYSDARILTSG